MSEATDDETARGHTIEKSATSTTTIVSLLIFRGKSRTKRFLLLVPLLSLWCRSRTTNKSDHHNTERDFSNSLIQNPFSSRVNVFFVCSCEALLQFFDCYFPLGSLVATAVIHLDVDLWSGSKLTLFNARRERTHLIRDFLKWCDKSCVLLRK